MGPLFGSQEASLQIDARSEWALCKNSNELLAAPIVGHHPAVPLGFPSTHEFRPGASSVVYVSDQYEVGVFELFLRPLPLLRAAQRVHDVRPR